MRKIKLSKIVISDDFKNSKPSEEKIERRRHDFKLTGIQSRYIVIDKNNILIDGYIQYLILKENNIDEAYYIRYKENEYDLYKNKTTTYVYGKHLHSRSKKEFIWKIPENWNDFAGNIQIGDIIYCSTQYGNAPVEITKIITTDMCPVNFKVKRVSSNIIKRNNVIV